MKEKTSLFWFGIIMIAVGDFFYFASLLFRSFMTEFITSMSSAISATSLNQSGETILLLLASMIGALMYFIGSIFIALSREEKENQRKIILAGLILWFITDSIASLIFGFDLNIILNLILLITGIIFYKITEFD